MTEAQAQKVCRYHALLTEANARMNLTRVSPDPRESADRNYLDSIAPLSQPFPGASTAVDVGSGAGFPGIPLAIMLPEVRFTLLDSLKKRVAFLQSVIDELGLNAEAVHLRAEDAGRDSSLRERFDLAVARAVAPMNVLCELMLPLVRVGGRALCMKGPGLQEELDGAGHAIQTLGGRLERVDALPIPGRDWNHCAAWISKVSPTPARYPRQAGTPGKAPI